MKKQLYIIIILLCGIQSTECNIIVKGNSSTTPFGFETPVSTRALDPYSGIFYVGLSSGNDAYTLSKINRYAGTANPSFFGFAPTDLQNTSISYLTLSCTDDNAARLVGSESNEDKKVFILKNDGTSFSQTANDLNDANGDTSNGVVGVASSSKHIIAAVLSDGETDFGISNSGLALVEIQNNLSLNIKNANTGAVGNTAILLNESSLVFKGAGNDVQMDTSIGDDNPVLLYDKLLDRFYVGKSMETGKVVDDIGKSVAIAYIDETNNNRITLQAIAPDSTISSANDDQIILAKVLTVDEPIFMSVQKIGILHASTGPTYLIVSGESTLNTGAPLPRNNIYALPLVDNPSNASIHGTLAKKDSTLSNGKFVTAATAIGDNPLNTEPAVLVGGTSLPIENTNTISDMMVVGDTVYVSIKVVPDDDNEPGIFYSHALFDEDGKIITWTPWTKKVLPLNPFPGTKLSNGEESDGTVSFFQVDIVNGKIWFVENTTNETVGTTLWTAPSNALKNSLAQQLNIALPNSAYTVLDLDQSTREFCDQTVARYALFGGIEKVAFTRTTIAENMAINSPQTTSTDFSLPENFLLTTLPNGAGCCQTLEYSRQPNSVGALNYFFAGTNNGLYVFAEMGTKNGFTIQSTVNELNAVPFSDSQWFKADNISGSVIALKTTGNTLYILTQEITPTIQSTLYRVDFMGTVDSMFMTSNIITIAQTGSAPFLATPGSGTEPLEDISFFYDLGIISIADDGSEEQIVLATSRGLYISTKATGVQGATDAIDAEWTNLETLNKNLQTPFLGITCPDNAPISDCGLPTATRPTTVWPFSLTDPSKNGIFSNSKLFQVAGSSTNDIDRVPLDFTSKNLPAAFNNLDPIINFFTDGARRFIITNPPSNPLVSNNLVVLPFDTTTWNVASQTASIVRDPQLANINAMFWTHQIGATGSLLMGTDRGVYTLD